MSNMDEFRKAKQAMQRRVTPTRVIVVAIVVLVAAVAVTSIYEVDQTEQAVVMRFGNYVRTEGPGLQTKLPFGIEENYNVPVQQVQTQTFGFRTESAGVSGERTQYSETEFPEESIMLTGDLNIVDVEWIIQYRITEPRDWLFNVEEREKTIRDISQSTINQLVGDRSIFNVLGSQRARIEQEGLAQMNETFDSYQLGISVSQVRLQNIVPPSGRVQDAFEDVNRAVQDMNRLINEGRQDYNREIPRVRGQAERLLQEAEGYASRRINEAEGGSDRFNAIFEAYQEAPQITRNRLYIEAMESIFDDENEIQVIDRELQNLLPIMNLQGNLQGAGSE